MIQFMGKARPREAPDRLASKARSDPAGQEENNGGVDDGSHRDGGESDGHIAGGFGRQIRAALWSPFLKK